MSGVHEPPLKGCRNIPDSSIVRDPGLDLPPVAAALTIRFRDRIVEPKRHPSEEMSKSELGSRPMCTKRRADRDFAFRTRSELER